MDKTIKITGTGNLAVRPDLMRLKIRLEALYPKYDVTLEQSSKMTEVLRELLKTAGFEKEDLKTVSFDIRTVYKNIQTEDGDWKEELQGYQFEHRLKLEFPIDNEKLGKVLYAFAQSGLNPLLSIEYTISDVERVKNTLIAQAVKDAKTKAEILAEAAEVKLGSIIHIDYSWNEENFMTSPVNDMQIMKCMSRAEERYDLDLEAEDIKLTDAITVTWKLS